MKRLLSGIAVAFLISGCAPKMGEDIAIEMGQDIRLENRGAEVVLGILSILGASQEKIPLKIGGDITLINRWHSDLQLRSLTYALWDEKGNLAAGSAKIDPEHPFLVSAHTQRKLPLSLVVDPAILNPSRLIAAAGPKSKVMLRGEAVVQVWGKEIRYPFEKDAKKIVEKLSQKRLSL